MAVLKIFGLSSIGVSAVAVQPSKSGGDSSILRRIGLFANGILRVEATATESLAAKITAYRRSAEDAGSAEIEHAFLWFRNREARARTVYVHDQVHVNVDLVVKVDGS